MSEQEPLKIEIDIEDDTPNQGQADDNNVVDELGRLGRQFAETLRAGLNSSERQRFEADVREGARSFRTEVERVVGEVRAGDTGQKLRAEATEIRTQFETGELGEKARTGFTQGLRWLSEELDKLADQFTEEAGAEKSPDGQA